LKPPRYINLGSKPCTRRSARSNPKPPRYITWNRYINLLIALAVGARRRRLTRAEECEVDGGGHPFVPGVVGMQIVLRGVLRQQPRRPGGVAQRRVEIDHGVVRAARAYPLVQSLARGLVCRRVVVVEGSVLHRRER